MPQLGHEVPHRLIQGGLLQVLQWRALIDTCNKSSYDYFGKTSSSMYHVVPIIGKYTFLRYHFSKRFWLIESRWRIKSSLNTQMPEKNGRNFLGHVLNAFFLKSNLTEFCSQLFVQFKLGIGSGNEQATNQRLHFEPALWRYYSKLTGPSLFQR